MCFYLQVRVALPASIKILDKILIFVLFLQYLLRYIGILVIVNNINVIYGITTIMG